MRNSVSPFYDDIMTCITVYYLSINSNYRLLAAELNYRFTEPTNASPLEDTADEMYLSHAGTRTNYNSARKLLVRARESVQDGGPIA